MNLQQFQQRLQRDLKRNPKQAAALGLLLVVAAWFWAPLVWGWLPKGSPAAPQAASPSLAAATAAGAPQAADAPASERLPSWSELVDWMKNDPLMAPATHLPHDRNPFASPMVAAQEAEQSASRAALAWTPEQAGLVLSSTIVGPTRRTALINGRAYAQGRQIVQMHGQEPIVFQLAEVHPKHVVLVRDDQRYKLKLAEDAALSAVVVAPAASP